MDKQKPRPFGLISPCLSTAVLTALARPQQCHPGLLEVQQVVTLAREIKARKWQ